MFLHLFKVGDLFSVKDAIPKFLKSFVVYRLLCPGCIVFSSLKLRGGFLVFEIWTKRGVMKKLLRNRGCSLRKGGFQIVPSVFLQKSMFSLLAVINRSILSCGLLFTRKWYIMKFVFLSLLFLTIILWKFHC